MRKRFLIFTLLLLAIPLVSAAGITFSLDQKEYYFKVGKDAIINLQSENTYKENIDGLLSYTITQSINQGNFQYSSTNTKSTSFSVGPAKTQTPISFGTSDTPLTLSIALKFSYTKDDAQEVSLDGIKIHFVTDDSQKQNEQDQVSSSSQKASTSQQQQNDPFAQQQQNMQQMINQMLGNQQPQQQQTAEQRLQNNQMSQDSSALKQEMQEQLKEQQEMKQEFQKQLEKDQELMQEHQELLDKGFNMTGGDLNPTSNNTGDFELDYKDKDGKKASLKGQMQDGQVQNLQKDTPENRQKALEQLQQNKKFQQYQKQLQDQGFTQQDMEFSQDMNMTDLKVNYKNSQNETASIKAEITNNTVQKVELTDNTEKDKKDHWWIFFFILFLGILGYFVYKRFNKKQNNKQPIENIIPKKPFDYKAESLAMLKKAKELFEKKEYKDAYMLAGQALRLYLSYENKLNKEITNDEIIEYLRLHKRSSKEAKRCFDLCSLVEFAKYKANEKDFNQILGYADKLIQ